MKKKKNELKINNQKKVKDIDFKDNNKELNKKIKELYDEIKKEKENNKKLNKKIIELNDLIKKEKENNINLNKKIKELNGEIKKEKENNKELNKKIKKLKKYENLMQDLNNPINKVIEVMEKLEKKENEIRELKQISDQLITEKSKLINIIFTSNEEDFYWPTSCKNDEKFNTIENIFYEKYPEFMKFDIFYEVRGLKINKLGTLKENNIQNNDIITLIKKNK